MEFKFTIECKVKKEDGWDKIRNILENQYPGMNRCEVITHLMKHQLLVDDFLKFHIQDSYETCKDAYAGWDTFCVTVVCDSSSVEPFMKDFWKKTVERKDVLTEWDCIAMAMARKFSAFTISIRGDSGFNIVEFLVKPRKIFNSISIDLAVPEADAKYYRDSIKEILKGMDFPLKIKER